MVQALKNTDNKYIIPIQYRKEITTVQSTDIVKAFEQFDLNGDGIIDQDEFKTALTNMGYRDMTDEAITELVASVDSDKDGVIQWSEFCDMMYKLIKSSNELDVAKIINKAYGDQEGQTIIGTAGASHHYALEEVSAASRMINKTLQDIEELEDRIPIDVENPDDLFNTLSDGYVGLHLLNAIQEDTIDLSKIKRGQNLNVFE